MPSLIPTRTELETELNLRVGGLLYFVFVKAWDPGRGSTPSITPTGSNPVYNGAIGWAMDLAGCPADNPAAVAADDMARIPPSDYSIVTDLAEYRLIATALGNYIQPDVSASGRSQAWGSLRGQFQARLKDLETAYASYLKANRFVIGYGSIRLPIASGPCGEYYPGNW